MKLWIALAEAGLLVGPGLWKVLPSVLVQLMAVQGVCSLPFLRGSVQATLVISVSVLVMLR